MIKKALTLILTGGLVTLFSLNDSIVPNNTASIEEERLAFAEKLEMFDDMKSVVQNGLIKIELYDEDGTLVGTAENTEDFDNDLKSLFTGYNLTIKTVTKTDNLLLP